MFEDLAHAEAVRSYAVFLPATGVEEGFGALYTAPLETLRLICSLPNVTNEPPQNLPAAAFELPVPAELLPPALTAACSAQTCKFRTVHRTRETAIAVSYRSQLAVAVRRVLEHSVVALVQPGSKPAVSAVFSAMERILAEMA